MVSWNRSTRTGVVLFILLLSMGRVAPTTAASPAPDATSYFVSASVNVPTAINPVNPVAIPLGDGNVTTSPERGYVDSCTTNFSSTAGGAQVVGPWVNQSAKTWDEETKIAVEGSVSWPSATFSISTSGNQRLISGNDEPIDHPSGTFPISHSDPAYQYDANPNHIAAQNINWAVAKDPVFASSPSCLNGGPIGVLLDGVYLYDALDGEGRDAAAHEILDAYGAHPDQSYSYHHHEVPAFMYNSSSPDSATLVGYAKDGLGIFAELDASGNLLTNDNLDACHGRTSLVPWDGQMVDMYHYDVTLEYPYTIGCFMASMNGPGSGQSVIVSTSTSSITTSSTTKTTTISSASSSASGQTSTSYSNTAATTTSTAVSTSLAASTTTAAAPEFTMASLALLFGLVIAASAIALKRAERHP